jgi:2'-hydroxyisoflavone reductase
MSMVRRDFLKNAAAVSGALTFAFPARGGASSPVGPAPDGTGAPAAAAHPLDILILGGTTFLGPHQIRYALERGHSISIFTRGQTQPTVHRELFGEVEHLTGDRNDDLTALEGRTWDAVIDNSGRRVEWTRDTAQLLKDRVEIYVYTSSTGVYLPYLGDDLTEDTQLVLEDPPEVAEDRRPTYGVMKSLSEIEARAAFGDDRAIIVRPTYIIGPADPTNRFPYWPVRLHRGGEVLVPGKGHDRVQLVDVRDLTEWMIRLIENRTAGTFNAAGPASPMGMHAFVHGVHAATSSAVSWVMVPDYDFLEAHEVQYAIPWLMPVGDYVGSARINIDRAVASGLTFRPLALTSMDTLEWWFSDAVTEERRQGLLEDPRSLVQREAQIIADWKARQL